MIKFYPVKLPASIRAVPGSTLVLLLWCLQACRPLKPDAFPEKYVIPTFEGTSLVRLPAKDMELTFYGDYHFFMANKKGRKIVKRTFPIAPGKKDTLLLWGGTTIPAYYRFYLVESADSTLLQQTPPGKIIATDSFYAGGNRVYASIAENEHAGITAWYTFRTGNTYRLVFTGNYQTSYTGNREDSLLSNSDKLLRFQTETRFIIHSLKTEIPTRDIDFSEVNQNNGQPVNNYADYARKVNKLETYYPKELTPLERNVLCQFLATFCTFTGDYEKAICYDSVINPRAFKKYDGQGITATDATNAILQQAKKAPILFFNESHVDVRTRAFLITLLPQLKQLGYNKLALEALFQQVDSFPTGSTGFYTREPVYGLLLRKAKEYGYTLVRYEDTLPGHTRFSQRDAAQAANLLHALTATKDTGKTIVLAGYSHIYKSMEGTRDTSMAQYFMRSSGIVPFCIDAANANKNDYGVGAAAPYLLYRNGEAVTDKPARYDWQVHYPGRYYTPEVGMARAPFPLQWVSLSGEGPTFPVKQPVVVLVYLHSEYERVKNSNELVPVQVARVQAGGGAPIVYLEPGRYNVCVLNEQGKVLQQKMILVK